VYSARHESCFLVVRYSVLQDTKEGRAVTGTHLAQPRSLALPATHALLAHAAQGASFRQGLGTRHLQCDAAYAPNHDPHCAMPQVLDIGCGSNYLFRLMRRGGSSATDSAGSALGKLEIKWRGSLGEVGRLQTQQILGPPTPTKVSAATLVQLQTSSLHVMVNEPCRPNSSVCIVKACIASMALVLCS